MTCTPIEVLPPAPEALVACVALRATERLAFRGLPLPARLVAELLIESPFGPPAEQLFRVRTLGRLIGMPVSAVVRSLQEFEAGGFIELELRDLEIRRPRHVVDAEIVD